MRNEYYTDYPIVELGDTPGEEAPIRACTIVKRYHFASKYVLVNVEGVEIEIKKGYIYTEPGRLGDVPVADLHSEEMTGRKSTLIIFHGNCADGWTAAWAAWLKFGDSADYQAAHYPSTATFCFDVDGRDVYFLDYCPTRETLLDFHGRAKSLQVIDHHKTAEEACRGLDFAIFNMTKSGAGLAWDFFHPNEARPNLVDYVEDRDLWNWKLPHSKEVNAYIQSTPREDFRDWSTLQEMLDVSLTLVANTGGILLRAEQLSVDNCKNSVRNLTFVGHLNVPVVNVNGANVSALLNQLALWDYFAVGWYQDAEGRFRYSLRAQGNFDVAKIAEKFGGGGHKLAAGFTSERPPWELSEG